MEAEMEMMMICSEVQIFRPRFPTHHSPAISLNQGHKPLSGGRFLHSSTKGFFGTPKFQINAVRRRRPNMESETYVLMEPGKNEEFVSEDELRDRLKEWLQNWPGTTLPPDLARFDTIEDAVQFLVKSVCELEIDGDVGSLQWYQVRLD